MERQDASCGDGETGSGYMFGYAYPVMFDGSANQEYGVMQCLQILQTQLKWLGLLLQAHV